MANAAGPNEWLGLLIQAGVAGVVLAWFMFRTEARLKGIENAVDRMARANLLLVLSLRDVNNAAKNEASAVIKEIDDAKARDLKP